MGKDRRIAPRGHRQRLAAATCAIIKHPLSFGKRRHNRLASRILKFNITV